MGAKYQQRNGEKLVDFRARCASSERAEKEQRKRDERNARRRRSRASKMIRERAERTIADHIDGFDRDDLGHSVD